MSLQPEMDTSEVRKVSSFLFSKNKTCCFSITFCLKPYIFFTESFAPWYITMSLLSYCARIVVTFTMYWKTVSPCQLKFCKLEFKLMKAMQFCDPCFYKDNVSSIPKRVTCLAYAQIILFPRCKTEQFAVSAKRIPSKNSSEIWKVWLGSICLQYLSWTFMTLERIRCPHSS